jgi:hypothetical protein
MQKMRCLIALSDISQRVNVEVFSYLGLLRKSTKKKRRRRREEKIIILFVFSWLIFIISKHHQRSIKKDERGFYS